MAVFKSSPTDPTQKLILLWLSDLDRRAGGYELRGVRGWAHPKEIAADVGRRITDELTRLAERRQVDRENIALPRRGTPIWLYRINARGSHVAGVAAPAELAPPETERSPLMIFTDPQWAALKFMRNAKIQSAPTLFITKELGWRTMAEIRDRASARYPKIQVWPEDVYQLERTGLLERRSGPGIGHERPIPFYRVTELGENVGRLQWHVPAPSAGT